ncbi:MAG TPA: SRPBCC family protein [Caulobacteraceae bacterium]|nr:SRPBCC family protein [Caulobacteraceae bacterium]
MAVAAWAAATAAHAWTPQPGDGPGPYAEVEPDYQGHRSGVIHGFVDIPAPAARVWRLMLDCTEARRMVPFVRSCRVLERDPGGAWDVREHVVDYGFPFPRIRSVFRSEYQPLRLVRFHCLPNGELKVCDGEWRLEPRPGGVRVIYENRLTSPFPAPAALVRGRMRHDVLGALAALKRLALEPDIRPVPPSPAR